MAEYIDREKLLMGIEALPCDGCTDIDCGECIQELIDDAEPEDAQPVRHGRWITEDEYYVDDTYICSLCGYEFIITDGDLESNELNYCPGCGAKMDGKDTNVPANF